MKVAVNIKYIIGLAAMLFLFAGCRKDEINPERSSIDLFLGAAPWIPENMLQENIQIRAVQVHYVDESKGTNGWIELDTRSGAYNMLGMQDSLSSVLCASGTDLEPGAIDQVRLSLMEGNHVMLTDSTIAPLYTTMFVLEGTAIACHTTLEGGSKKSITLEFDAKNSISKESDIGYRLNPLLRVRMIMNRRVGKNAAA